jgi:hypothetical protein
MTIVYVTTGAWGTGTGTPNSASQVDGNFYDVDQRIVDLNTDLAEGKRIDTVTYTSNSMTFHFTDGSSQVIPLPIATLSYVGEWTNSTPYARGNLVSVKAQGMYQVLVDHTTPPLPTVFDPNATDGTTDNNPLYELWFPLFDVNYDAAIFVPGSVQRNAGELLFQGVANRTMRLDSGNANAYTYLDAVIPSGGSNIIISIQKNAAEVGTITFTVASGHVGTINIPATTDFAEGDRYALRVTSSNNAAAADLSITLPFIRTDI